MFERGSNRVQGRTGDIKGAEEPTNRLGATRLGEPSARAVTDAGRKRAAVELIASHGPAVRRTARRYSLCVEDAEDAYQRTLEILLTKAPGDRARELLGWTKTVVKHEALAIRKNRERLLGTAAHGHETEDRDPVAMIPADGAGPDECLERREEIARSREALRALKPAELRALTLLGEGYSYAEIGAITGFSQTKVNRCLAEGRERFRRFVSSSEDGSRCREMSRLLSAFCDAETNPEETVEVREHLRACARCRVAMRAYRAAPATAAALAPALPLTRSLLDRVQELLFGIQSRLPGAGGAADASMAQVAAAGGTKGAGMAALAKLLAVCAGTVGGAACVATGIAPVPLDLVPDRLAVPRIERIAERVVEQPPPPAGGDEAMPAPIEPIEPEPSLSPAPEERAEAFEPEPSSAEPGAEEATEPAPPPPTPAAPSTEPPAPASGSAAGEFGP